MYTPNNWIVFHVKGHDDQSGIYKVLAGWSGGYLDGDSWRINSGIDKVEFDGDYFKFYGASGSCYKCHKDSYGLRMNTAGIWSQLKEKAGDRVTILNEDTDWLSIV